MPVIDLSDRYIRKVLENAAIEIARAPNGTRNSLLFAKSATVFEYFVGARLAVTGARPTLREAGLASGLDAREVDAVLDKAWARAQSHPRHVPPPKTPVRAESSARSEPAAQAPEFNHSLLQDSAGNIKNTFANICKILRGASGFVGRLSYDEMRVSPMLDGRAIKDADIAAIREQVEARWGFSPSTENVMQAVLLVSSEHSFHPVQDYLAGLEWDGELRIVRVASHILGIEQPSFLVQRMIRCWFLSAVARARNPGCKVDTCLVLVGDQGEKKSTFFSVLGGQWFSDSYADITTKDGILQVHAAWIYEWAEVDKVTTRRSASDVKAFLSVAKDLLRPPYGRGVLIQPRSSVIVGTTNKSFLDDETGSRRFWPIRIGVRIDREKLEAWRDQLWAEACVGYLGGEPWWLSDDEEGEREQAADEHRVEDPWEEPVRMYVKKCELEAIPITSANLLAYAVGLDTAHHTPDAMKRVGKCMRTLGYDNRRAKSGDTKIRVWRKLNV
ncbi:virulence-associated E family protein [Pendulispora brunnea]|uniref:Virulence-associated E family protein n=1 Tax=Pendulispora brunnea TaxID=2905690 RepID=A0ABZ2KGN4_9BACT